MEMLDTASWRWGLSLIALTMAIHATVVVLMAFVGVRVRARLESRDLKSWNLVAILICTNVVIGLVFAVLHGTECGMWAAAYLWLGALNSPTDALLFSVELDEYARRLRSDAATTLADDGCSGSSRRDSAIWCERGVYFRRDAGVLVNARRACDPQQKLTQEDPIVHSLSRQLSSCPRRRRRSSITTFSRCDDLALL